MLDISRTVVIYIVVDLKRVLTGTLLRTVFRAQLLHTQLPMRNSLPSRTTACNSDPTRGAKTVSVFFLLTYYTRGLLFNRRHTSYE